MLLTGLAAAGAGSPPSSAWADASPGAWTCACAWVCCSGGGGASGWAGARGEPWLEADDALRRAAVRGLSDTAAARMPTAEALLGAPPSSTCAASAAAETHAAQVTSRVWEAAGRRQKAHRHECDGDRSAGRQMTASRFPKRTVQQSDAAPQRQAPAATSRSAGEEGVASPSRWASRARSPWMLAASASLAVPPPSTGMSIAGCQQPRRWADNPHALVPLGP